MKPHKKLKKHDLTKKKFRSIYGHTQEELVTLINEAASQIHQNSIRRQGSGYTIFCGSDMANKLDSFFTDD